jgi:hypothetical protein
VSLFLFRIKDIILISGKKPILWKELANKYLFRCKKLLMVKNYIHLPDGKNILNHLLNKGFLD